MVLSELKLCMFGIVAFVECCNVIIFLPSMSYSVFQSCSPNELVFVFLCCFCVSFFLTVPKLLEVMVVLLPGENSKCKFLRQYEHP